MRRILPIALCLGALALAPATADAGTVSLKGQVVGSPYAAGARSAVPVLLSPLSARKAKLRSALGVVLISRSGSIPAPGGAIKPSQLRLGDSFSAKARTSKTSRKASYPRLVGRGLRVSKRGTTLSNAELYSLVAQLRKDLDGLTAYVLGELARLNGLLGGLTSQAASTRSQLDSLTSTLSSVTAGLAELQSLVGQLPANLQSTLDSLTSQVGSLQSTASTLTGQMSGALGSISTLQGLLSGITTPGQLSTALTDISSLQGLVTGLTGSVGALTSQINGVGGLQADVTTLCSDIAILGLNLPLMGLSLCP